MTSPMEYRRFGKTEEKISVITLGGMRFKHGWTPPRNHLPKDSIEKLYFDNSYGIGFRNQPY